MIDYIVITIVSLVILKLYSIDYYKGLYSSIFILILFPVNISIELSIVLPSITIHRVLFIIMLIKWATNPNISKRFNNIPFIGILLLISLSYGISVTLSSNILVSLKRYLYFLTESILFYVVIITSLKKEQVALHLIKTVSCSLISVAVFGIIEHYTMYNISDIFGMKQSYEFETLFSYGSGIKSLYGHRILFGIGMSISLMISLYFLEKAKATNMKQRLLDWVPVILSGSALYFSMSRGPWLSFAIASLFGLIIYTKKTTKRIIILSLIIAGVFIIRPGTYLTVNELYESTLDTETLKGSSYEWRYQVLNMAYTMVNNSESILNYLFGFGQGSHIFLNFPEVRLTTGHYTKILSWDNEFAVILLEHGYIGFLLLLYFYFKVLKRGIIKMFANDKDKDIIFLTISNLFIIIFMKTNVKIFAPQIVYIEFINLAIFGSILMRHRTRSNSHIIYAT